MRKKKWEHKEGIKRGTEIKQTERRERERIIDGK